MRRLLWLALLGAALIAMVPAAGAHESESVGNLTISIGWRTEPTYAGLPNAVEITVVDADGEPVADPVASLSATISFGDATVVRPLLALDEPGKYGADLIPTQPGTYSFQIMGTLAGETLDVASTCSDATFDCVADPAEVEFPPRSATDVETAGGPVAADDGDGSSSATFVIVASALTVIAVAAIVMVGLRARRPEQRG